MSDTALAARPISEAGFHAAPHGRIARPLRTARTDHATAPIDAAFDWPDCLADTPTGSYYLVVFRSTRRVGADHEMLTEFDDLAHAEARLSGGLHFYFKGEPDPGRACLSLCLWDSPGQARAALGLPGHQAAARLARDMYDSFRLERYQVSWDQASLRIDLRML